MTRTHFQIVAAALAETLVSQKLSPKKIQAAAEQFADGLKASNVNPNFKRERFVDAVICAAKAVR